MGTKEAIHVAMNAIDDVDELRKQLSTALAAKEEAERARNHAVSSWNLADKAAHAAEAQLAAVTAERDRLKAIVTADGLEKDRLSAGWHQAQTELGQQVARLKPAEELAKAGSKYRAKVGEYVNRLKYTNGGPPLPGPDLILSGDEFGTALARWQELTEGGG